MSVPLNVSPNFAHEVANAKRRKAEADGRRDLSYTVARRDGGKYVVVRRVLSLKGPSSL